MGIVWPRSAICELHGCKQRGAYVLYFKCRGDQHAFCENRDHNGTPQDIGCNNKNGVVLSNCCYRTGSSNAIYVNCIKLGANESPKFNENLNPDYPYYMPRNKSPVVGKGLVFGWPDGAVDLGGYPRLNGERIDIGCYEAWISTGLILMVW